jgi:hypothetical protein
MATVEATAVRTIDDEREQLLSFGMPELRVIAEEIGADSARSKAQLVENILAKKTGEAAEEIEAPDTAGVAPGDPSVPGPGVPGGDALLSATEVEADAQADAAREAIAADENEEAPPVLVKHLMLTMFDRADENIGIKDQVGVNEEVDKWLARGYEIDEFQTLGFSPGGHKLFWVFKKVDEPRYTRSMHLMRLLTPQPNPIRGTITGWQADAYISAFIEAGWRLIGARYNGDDVLGETTTGIYIIWCLVK